MKKIMSAILAAVMVMTSICTASVTPLSAATSITAESGGWNESAYVEWLPVSGAAKYEAYVKGNSDANYTKLDDELIRQYNTYCRADAVGIKAGTYSMKIVALDSADNEIAAVVKDNIAVSAYDRTGFAFSSESPNKTSSGGYNDDGTPADNAIIIYVTNENKNSIQLDVITNNKGGTTTGTGIAEILQLRQKGIDTRPLIFRFIGEITAPAFSSSTQMLDIKKTSNITMEGIGNDTIISGWGFHPREANNVEIRNFGIKDFTSSDEDAVSIESKNANIWVHNNDIFYGGKGSDKDQAKGDGSIDLKGTSSYITIAENHFWDSGKASLCGLSESADYYVTYNNNWFDHSDSRHPRVRRGSIHVYNNYYDGVAKYGVGMTSGGSSLVENNYFRNTSKPMMISKQGTDGNGDGTFSGEDGGIIKVFNNIMTGSYTYIEGTIKDANGNKTYDQWADGYSVDSRKETLPSSLTSYSGGTSYNNFDTTKDLAVTESDIVDTKDVPAVVMSTAGRCNGGDFFYEFNDITDDESYAVLTEMTNALASYKSNIITIGGTVKTAPNTSATPISATGVDGNKAYAERDTAREKEASVLPAETEEDGNKATGGGGGTTGADLSLKGSDLSAATLTSNLIGVGTDGKFDILADSTKTVTISSSKGIQLGGSGSVEYRAIRVTTEKAGTVYVTSSSTGTDTRVLNVTDASNKIYGTIDTGSSTGVVLPSAGTYYIYSTNKGINVNGVNVVYNSDETNSTETTTEGSTETTTEGGSTETTTESSTETTTETTTDIAPDDMYGDADGDGILSGNDCAMIMQYVLNKSSVNISDDKIKYIDVDGDGIMTANDAAEVLSKILNSSFIFGKDRNK